MSQRTEPHGSASCSSNLSHAGRLNSHNRSLEQQETRFNAKQAPGFPELQVMTFEGQRCALSKGRS